MKTRIFIVTICFITLISSQALASAVLLDAKGRVSIALPGKKSMPAKAGIELPDGSVVTVEKGGKASVLLETGAVDEIAAGTSYTVGPMAKGARRTELGSGVALAMRELSAGGTTPTVHGMVKEARGPAATQPPVSATDKRTLDAEIAKVRALNIGADGKAMLIAQLYYQRGMYNEMVRTLEPVWQRTHAPYVGKLLKYGYSQMGWSKEAARFQ